MTRHTTLNGQTKTLVVETNGGKTTARWGEHNVELDIQEIGPGVYNVRHGHRSITVTMGAGGWAQAGGRVFEVESIDPRDAAASTGAAGRGGQMKVKAPMPGKVIRVLVQKGDAVTAGQGLLVVEAMKMQNEMKAPRDATVLAVQTQEAATVAAGDVLLILE